MAHTEFELLDQLEEELLEGEPEEEAAEVELLLPSSPVQYAASVLRGLSSGSERAAVRRAVASGQRDENALTNLVFFARHPERGGCRPARSEPGFVPLAYWTKRIAFEAGLRQCCTDIVRFSHGASSSKKVYRSSFIPGLHDVCMIFEKP